jgi:hypothetical protein
VIVKKQPKAKELNFVENIKVAWKVTVFNLR